MTTSSAEPFLKYAIFCRETSEGQNGELNLNDVVDLVEIPYPQEPPRGSPRPLAELDLQLVFCVGGAAPGTHHLLVGIKAPGIPLETPPPQRIEWEEGILFLRQIKLFRIPVMRVGTHVAAILLDGAPLGQASFLVRFKDEPARNPAG